MKLCFFGTGHGVPEAHKKCASTLLQVGDNYYLVDAGCDIAYELAQKRIPFEKVKAIFITHPHSDHTNGLIPFLTLTLWYYTASNPAIYLPSQKMLNSYEDHILPGLRITLRPEQKLTAYESGVIYDDGVIKVTAFPTQHCPDSHAFLVEAEGKRVLFSGDLWNPKVDFPAVDDLDAAIVEGAHFSIMDYEEIFRERNIKAAYINHYGNYIGYMNSHNLAPLQAAVAPMPVLLTTDGMDIEV